MSDLIVVAFDNEAEAEKVRQDLLKMQKEHLVDIEDAAVAVRDKDGQIHLHQMFNTTAAGALNGGFWGLLIGLIFSIPFGPAGTLLLMLGSSAVGAGSGALFGALADYGVDDKFIKEVSDKLQPGTSAIFALLHRATYDKVLDELDQFKGTVIQTSLSKDAEAQLKKALSGKS